MGMQQSPGPIPREIPQGVEPFVTSTRVRFEDIDGMGHANNARYLTYTEEARLYWARDSVGVEGMEDLGFILAHASVDFLAPARVAQELRVRMWVPRVGGKSWDFAYVLDDAGSGRVFAVARTTQVAFDYAKGVSVEIPQSVRQALESMTVPSQT
jgi:acyl-CoA thioester hydrolase